MSADLQVPGSRDQAAVDAARPQSPLQSSFLPLGSQDGDDGLVKHGFQALLGQRRAFHVATGTDLRGREGKVQHSRTWVMFLYSWWQLDVSRTELWSFNVRKLQPAANPK